MGEGEGLGSMGAKCVVDVLCVAASLRDLD